MKETLQQRFVSCAHEYARLFGAVIGYKLEFWLGILDGHHACFGDNYFFSFEEMCMVVDKIDEWRSRYCDSLGDVILEWYDYYTDIDHFEERTVNGRPLISLWSWLKGKRPEILNNKKQTQ